MGGNSAGAIVFWPKNLSITVLYVSHHRKDQKAREMQASETTVDPSEVAKFEAMAAEWWDPNGKFKPLHMLNPCRLDYITTQIAVEYNRDLGGERPFDGLRI